MIISAETMKNDIAKMFGDEKFDPKAFGYLTYKNCHLKLRLQVCESIRGFYVGTWDIEGPIARESLEYWPTRHEAENALKTGEWNQYEPEI